MQSKKIAVVTGASNGIGAGIAKILAQDDYVVIVTYYKNRDSGEKVVQDIKNNKGKAHLLELDVMGEESVKQCFSWVKKEYGKLNLLVNNAGVDFNTPIEECSFEDWKTITRTKIDGNFLCTKYALPLLKKTRNTNIIIIMSSLGDKPDPQDPAYSVGTAGTICFIKAMSLALAKYGIRTNGVAPSETRTNLRYYKDMGNSDELWRKFAKENPLGRVCTPEDIGKTVLSIIENEFWNGNFIYVTGGNHLK